MSLCNIQCGPSQRTTTAYINAFPEELVHFVPHKNNPVFAGTGIDTWDKNIRERGYILHEENAWYMWYTGYTDINKTKWLGYATSTDGFNWTRYKDNRETQRIYLLHQTAYTGQNRVILISEVPMATLFQKVLMALHMQ
jgi:hypothetical protein